ncbi:hypothetical protein [Bradyrhizobium diazoefficiens]|uniref:hypothetical protein n=1 Tax=Bradyrhizobium diazoefficiens TaxID=1355477 RepID=UPI00272B1C11|nr:hypothetical protein [Bradyrhizobium diazoefficiens]WLA68137.1 hypothetical protein QNN01_16605 [Bradyrhizobium diazoefficiens]
MIKSTGPETHWQTALEGVDAVAARVHHKREKHSVQLYPQHQHCRHAAPDSLRGDGRRPPVHLHQHGARARP